jgi:glycosyltransferase involved in cell wall biosynthesis
MDLCGQPESVRSKALAIAVVLTSISRNAGGLFDAVRMLVLGLQDAGHRVTVFAIEDEHSQADRIQWKAVDLRLFPKVGPRQLGFSPRLHAALVKERFDVIHQHGIWQALSGAVTASGKKHGTPVVISPHGMLDPWAVRHSGWKKMIARRLFADANFSGATCFHALNESEAQAIRSYGIRSEVSVVPNGITLEAELHPPPELPVWPETKVVLFLGRLHKKKGLRELIEAFAIVHQVNAAVANQWTLVVAGWADGENFADLQNLVQENGLIGKVMFTGPLFGRDKEAAYAGSDVFCLPSFSEGLPMTVLEAWKWGLPVIMTEACNLPEGFARGAAIKTDNQPSALAETLQQTFQLSDSERTRIGQAGRDLVESRFGWPAIVEAHVEVYRWLIAHSPGDRRPPPCFRGSALQEA